MWDLIVSVPDHCLSFYFDPFRSVNYKYQFGYLYFAERNETEHNEIPIVINAVVKFKEK